MSDEIKQFLKQKRKDYIEFLRLIAKTCIRLHLFNISYTIDSKTNQILRRRYIRWYNPSLYILLIIIFIIMLYKSMVDVVRDYISLVKTMVKKQSYRPFQNDLKTQEAENERI